MDAASPQGVIVSEADTEYARIAEKFGDWDSVVDSQPNPIPGPTRKLDLAAVLAAPDEPVPYVVDRFAAAGFVTVLASHGGEGKSMLSLALAIGVACGSSPAGVRCRQGRALIIDGENGERLIGSRYRLAGGPPEGVAIHEATGLDIARDGDWLKDTITAEGATLVVLDSLRTLAPRMEENNGDTVLPVTATLRTIARETQAAIVVAHHRPKHGAGYRGSSVLRDQVDALFVLGRDPDDPERRTRRFLHCDPARDGKMRFDLEPAERWLSIDVSGGVLTLDAAEPYGGGERPPTKAEDYAERIPTIINSSECVSRSEIARRLGLAGDDRTVGRVLVTLADEGTLQRHDGKTYSLGLAHAKEHAKRQNGHIGTLAHTLKGVPMPNANDCQPNLRVVEVMAEMTLPEVFYETVRTSWHYCVLVAFYTILDEIEEEQFWPRQLLLNACGRHMVFPPEPEPLINMLDQARYTALELGREALHHGYGGSELRPAAALIAESRDAIAFSPILTPEQIEHILQRVDEVKVS
jgi:hypothetical protein